MIDIVTLLRAPLLAAFIALAGCTAGIAQESFYDPGKYHHTPDGFRNPPGSLERESKPFTFIRFFLRRLTEDTKKLAVSQDHVVPRDEAGQQLAATDNPRLTWINHATFLIGLDGLNIITDPLFSERASPFGFAGPKRFVPPGLEIPNLPDLDVILISHNHYDSYDFPALEKLAARKPETLVLVPLGLRKLTEEAGFTNVREVDWYDEVRLGGVTFTSTPAIHWSRRTLWDEDKSLWTGFKIAGSAHRIWFAGDTGFGPVFENEVAARIAPVDIALVPIGAFLPRDFMRPRHTNPQEAVELARIMGARTAVAMHWGTVPLGADTPADQVAAFNAADVPGVKKRLMRIGETVNLDDL